MKRFKHIKRTTAAVTALVLALSVCCCASASDGGTRNEKFVKSFNKVSNFLLNDVIFKALTLMVPDAASVEYLDRVDLETRDGFLEGDESFIDSPAGDAKWSLGYSEKSILPADFGVALKYARGSYIPYIGATGIYTDNNGEKEDLKVRTTVLDDGSGRGAVVFAVVDCIGLANTDVRRIREELKDFAAQNGIKSINVSATHTHTGIDTQGAWNNPVSAALTNMFSRITGKVKSGVNKDFLDNLIAVTAQSVKEAYASMTEGDLYFAKLAPGGILFDRTYPRGADGNIYRLEFIPADGSAPTLMVSFGTHPEIASYDWFINGKLDHKVSGDFVYYMEQVANAAGYNFQYIQGNVGTNGTGRGGSDDGLDLSPSHESAMRYGWEMGYIALGMDKTESEREELNESTGDFLGVEKYSGQEGYTVWYKGLKQAEETQLAPVLNVRHRQFLLKVGSNVSVFLTKTGIANNKLVKDKKTGTYYMLTEIGYMEIADSMKVFFDPGELYSELLTGAQELDGFKYECLRDLYGEDFLVFDLMNDAAGYIMPDNYYVMAGYNYNKNTDEKDFETWCLLVSPGENAASDIFGELIALVDEVK